MKENPLRNLLNKIIWSKSNDAENFEITFIHRGEVNNRKSILAKNIIKVGKSCFYYKENGETLIPFHRIVLIKNLKSGKVLWKKSLKVHED
ncbi:MAG: RNA repair domain-containing protein [Candidatus Bathyarchaeia archaeon]